MEFLQSHTKVIFQPGYDHPAYTGINPYALGFAMMADITRIAETVDTMTAYSWRRSTCVHFVHSMTSRRR